MRLKIQMASFDNGHSADTVYLPHVGFPNKHFLCQSDWYVLSMHFLHHGALGDDVSARIWVLNSEWVPSHIDLFVLPEWQVLYEDCVSFDCLCQWSEPTLSSHCTCFLLMNGSTLHRSSKNSCLRCLTNPVNQHWSSEVIYHSRSRRFSSFFF